MKYKTIKATTGIYFVTSVIASHRIIFTEPDICLIPLKSLDWFRTNGFWQLYSFCLMPNHLHFLVQVDKGQQIALLLARFHSYTGHEIVKYFQHSAKEAPPSDIKGKRHASTLRFFKEAALRAKYDRNHMVWEDSLVKVVESKDDLMGLLEYIHNNLLNKTWRLADQRSNYRYSSGCYYDEGAQAVLVSMMCVEFCNVIFLGMIYTFDSLGGDAFALFILCEIPESMLSEETPIHEYCRPAAQLDLRLERRR